ncbi:Crp/Fnr family transcriptional regulator [Muricauda sp. NFXS6]|uniref:Crp/Fnr family transcriptional regulator n=1 Tax=Allomuricauda sp. NFXS6 TaxID=2819094 RepID=UPI0032DE4C3D
MVETLAKHIERTIDFQVDPNLLAPYLSALPLGKKEHLFRQGELCTHLYFVVEGCLNMYFINNKGQNQTVQFALEHWWLTDFMAFRSSSRTEFNLQAVERSKVLGIDLAGEKDLLERFPELERYFRSIHERAYGASLVRMKHIYGLSKEELYHDFAQKLPDFVQRVPQYLLASFLGLSPEYLSELRGRELHH